MEEETRNAIEALAKRLYRIEMIVGASKKEGKNQIVDASEKDYKELKGGITMLIDEGFFSAPKSKGETKKQLALKGYYHPEGAVQVALARDFMKRKH